MCNKPKTPKIENPKPVKPAPPPVEEEELTPAEAEDSPNERQRRKRIGRRALRTDFQTGGAPVSTGLNIPS